ncbi:MAG TPA: cysteine desulfurase [Bacteroidales bacterium]|nr:cysteine desulfurase [Bacteroidales bacterium]HSA42989.1 cysteine desulfurase [Bacteroidales bacterium]
MLDPLKIRRDFPILERQVYGRPLVYFDNAATTQKPRQVIEAISDYYQTYNSNIHRGVHYLSQQATQAHENARARIRKFLNARESHEIIFTRGTTEAINLIAASFGKAFIRPGDVIMVSELEHHSNIVPWQLLCEDRGAELRVIPIDDQGEILMDVYRELLDERVKLVAVTHVSNALGTVVPVEEIIRLAHLNGSPVLVDGAQAVAHFPVDVQAMDADFYCFSGHKIFGPMGIGVLYGKTDWLEKMPPYQGGGEMISEVSFERTTYNELPFKFEAGTPSVSDTIGLDAALAYLEQTGLEEVRAYEHQLLMHLLMRLSEISFIRILGHPRRQSGVVSFLPGDIHPYDMGTILDKLGFALRTGNHCAQPLMNHFGIQGTIRASLAFYNTVEEIDRLAEAIRRTEIMFR